MDELFEAEQRNLTQEPLNPTKLTLSFEKGKNWHHTLSRDLSFPLSSLSPPPLSLPLYLSLSLSTTLSQIVQMMWERQLLKIQHWPPFFKPNALLFRLAAAMQSSMCAQSRTEIGAQNGQGVDVKLNWAHYGYFMLKYDNFIVCFESKIIWSIADNSRNLELAKLSFWSKKE